MTSLPLDSLRPFYAFCDPARGKTADALKRLSSRAAIVVCGRDTLGRVFVLYAWAKRVPANVLADQLFAVYERFRPKVFGVEANGMGGLFADVLPYLPKWQGRQLPFQAVMQPTNQEKDFRIRTRLQPIVGNGRMFLLDGDPGIAELKSELTTFPQNPLKDMVDALASCCALMPPMPTRRQRDAGVDQLLAHLRATGASPEAIRDADRRRLAWS